MKTKEVKFLQYDKSNVEVRRARISRPPFIALSKSGLIRLNKSLCELLNVDEDTRLAFLQDSDKKSNWYLRTDDPEGFPLRVNGNSAGFSAISLRTTIIESMDLVDGHLSIPIGPEQVISGIKVWPLLDHQAMVKVAEMAEEHAPEQN